MASWRAKSTGRAASARAIRARCALPWSAWPFGGFLGGYLYDISNGYAVSWMISFAAGLVSALLAMDLLSQGERAPAAASAPVVETPAPARTTRV